MRLEPIRVDRLQAALHRSSAITPAQMTRVIARVLDRGQAPDWARRCVAANHTVTVSPHPTRDAWCWFCTTCGKDRP